MCQFEILLNGRERVTEKVLVVVVIISEADDVVVTVWSQHV